MSRKQLTVKQFNDLVDLDNMLDDVSQSGLLDKMANLDCNDVIAQFISLVAEMRDIEEDQSIF